MSWGELIALIVLVAAAAFIWLKMNPVTPPTRLTFTPHFVCPTDKVLCNHLMCEGGPSSCLMARTERNNWQSVFRGQGCE